MKMGHGWGDRETIVQAFLPRRFRGPLHTPCAVSHNANSIILVAESIHLLAPFFLDAKFFAASNALNAVPVLPT